MNTKSEITLHQYGDTELWYAESDDKSWMLPLHVEWRLHKESDQHYAHVFPAGICFYQMQTVAINALLGFHDIQGRPNQWVITRQMCEALLHKAPGITAVRYYRWPGEAAPPIEQKPPIRTKMSSRGDTQHEKNRVGNDPVRRSFVEWLAKERKISSSIINAVLIAVADEGPVWMVLHRKPLDLGFVRLAAVPFRQNWKDIVDFKCKRTRRQLRTMLKLPNDDLWKALDAAGLPEILTSPHNVALRRSGKGEDTRLDYTLEAIPTAKFESIANRIEGQRMSRGPSAYIAEFEDGVEALYETLVLALRSYLSKIIKPYAAVRVGGMGDVLSFVPILARQAALRGKAFNRIPVRITPTDSSFSVLGSADDPRLISPPTAGVPKVPNLLPPAGNLRERTVNGEVDLIDGGGDDRMWMSYGGKGVTPEESVLAGGTAAGDGVAEGSVVI